MRTSTYRKNEFGEKYLSRINDTLESIEEDMISEIGGMEAHPTIFIVGVHRSGTTLLNQFILNRFDIAYPTNFIARFWKAPVVGSMLYKNLNINDVELDHSSDLGYTKGLNGPHEFGYFWKYWFPSDACDPGFNEKCRNENRFVDVIAALTSFHQKPMLFKNLHTVCFHIKALHRLLPKSIFIYIERDPFFVAQSTYESRLKLFGSEREWFGLKPPQFIELKEKAPLQQIVSQIYFARMDILKSLETIPEAQKLLLRYEDFISNHRQILTDINQLLKRNSFSTDVKQAKDVLFSSNNTVRLNKDLTRQLEFEIKTVFNE